MRIAVLLAEKPRLPLLARNAPPMHWRDSLAGCYGLVALPADETLVHLAIEQAINQQRLGARVASRFLITQPQWYGLWAVSPLKGEDLACLSEILSRVENVESAFQHSLREFQTALAAARRNGLAVCTAFSTWPSCRPLVATRKPLPPNATHPGATRSPMLAKLAAALAMLSTAKAACRTGSRPYFPLDRLLGAEQARELLNRYEAFRAKPRSPDQARSLPGGAAEIVLRPIRIL